MSEQTNQKTTEYYAERCSQKYTQPPIYPFRYEVCLLVHRCGMNLKRDQTKLVASSVCYADSAISCLL